MRLDHKYTANQQPRVALSVLDRLVARLEKEPLVERLKDGGASNFATKVRTGSSTAFFSRAYNNEALSSCSDFDV